ncbi:carboxypeptidase-like regulatory domain-containing protein [Variovorax sp. OV329]|uniref:carboxypeptidase-like regulatory domain-containing protein n=1 Tax=Variovorax sp. OV329 TaxID=1882825 RepID=UPI0008EBBF2A|nr:carboxypeptidase-like regulatory domain-containing protein [Variovorax sp. OV329]SFN52218.1 Carboxypeptidase regulatory-like domain-containing protein [Variovorax sp. OV329]
MRRTLSRILGSRFFWVPAILAIVVIGWNVYVELHNDGVVRGRVVGPNGEPVVGATVSMFEQNFNTNSPRSSTYTDAQGRFAFSDNRSHSIQLRAEMPDMRLSGQRAVRLFFRSQHVELSEPLRMAVQAPGG